MRMRKDGMAMHSGGPAAPAAERRLFRRYETAIPAHFVADGTLYDCVIRDLSLGGARLVPGRPELAGARGRLCFDELWYPPGLPARVVQASEAALNLAFELDETAEEALTFFLAASTG